MKKYKDFKPKVTNPYVPNEPIHFKYVKPEKDEPYVPDEPVHFKYVNPPKGQIKEEVSINKEKNINTWAKIHDNDHLGDYNATISDKLHKDEPNEDIKKHIKNYTKDSRNLNKHLIMYHKHPEENQKAREFHSSAIKHLDDATNHPIGHELHTYSGIGFDPKKVKKNNIIHLPAYTSTTHDKSISMRFMKPHNTDDNSQHILHIHMKPTDKGRHVDKLKFGHEHEYETILPRNTQLKVHHIPDIYKDNEGNDVHVWHATIHHQD